MASGGARGASGRGSSAGLPFMPLDPSAPGAREHLRRIMDAAMACGRVRARARRGGGGGAPRKRRLAACRRRTLPRARAVCPRRHPPSSPAGPPRAATRRPSAWRRSIWKRRWRGFRRSRGGPGRRARACPAAAAPAVAAAPADAAAPPRTHMLWRAQVFACRRCASRALAPLLPGLHPPLPTEL